MPTRKAAIIGISGCSSSGKTTLARLLRDIFPHTFILHEDDFYRPEKELPVTAGFVDWDCVEAISVADLELSLAHIRRNGTLPPDLESKEDQNSVGECPVSTDKIENLRDRVNAWLQPGQAGSIMLENAGLRICILDGFLLYCPEMESVMDILDIKLFLRVSRATATHRREARDGYVTLEGFWKDPPGYVEKVVWPNYVKSHEWLFHGGNVEGGLKQELLTKHRIQAPPGERLDTDMESLLEWAVDRIIDGLSNLS